MLEARVSTAPCVPGIREKVKVWRDGGYKGVTETTQILVNFWFCTDHRLPNGLKFQYHYFQREAVETLIYLYEVNQGLDRLPLEIVILEFQAIGEPVIRAKPEIHQNLRGFLALVTAVAPHFHLFADARHARSG